MNSTLANVALGSVFAWSHELVGEKPNELNSLRSVRLIQPGFRYDQAGKCWQRLHNGGGFQGKERYSTHISETVTLVGSSLAETVPMFGYSAASPYLIRRCICPERLVVAGAKDGYLENCCLVPFRNTKLNLSGE